MRRPQRTITASIGVVAIAMIGLLSPGVGSGHVGGAWAQESATPTAQVGAALTANEVAANGPLPGDVDLYAPEVACAERLWTPGYYPTLNGAEIADAQRSGVFPCATFTGSFDGPNEVFAWRSADGYPATSFLVNRRPGELFLLGGDNPALTGPVAPGPYVAKVDATTGEQIWRTYLDNANVSGHWIATTNLNILANGTIVTSWATKIALLDPDTGLILKTNTLPTGSTPAADASFKHLTVAPDGTLILKDQMRATGSTEQGSTAMFRGAMQGLPMGNSVVVAVDPETLEVLDWVELPEPSLVPHIITTFADRIAIYISGAAHAYRYFWDPQAQALSPDESWVVAYLQEGQSSGTAATLMGDWIAIQTNGYGSDTVASSIVAINQHDSTQVTTIFPFGPLEEGQFSFVPPKAGGDPENTMLYSADMGIGQVAGITFDPETGAMETAWVLDVATSTFQPVFGPPQQRVLVLTNMQPDVAGASIMEATSTGSYTEQVQWRDAATGDLLAASDFFEPLSINSLVVPGFGGRVYYPTGLGFITLQIMPQEAVAE